MNDEFTRHPGGGYAGWLKDVRLGHRYASLIGQDADLRTVMQLCEQLEHVQAAADRSPWAVRYYRAFDRGARSEVHHVCTDFCTRPTSVTNSA